MIKELESHDSTLAKTNYHQGHNHKGRLDTGTGTLRLVS